MVILWKLRPDVYARLRRVIMAMAMQHRVPDRVGACITEDDDFVLVCTNRAVLDVGLLSL